MAEATQTTLGTIRLSGDLGGSNDALLPQLSPTGVTPGTYTNPTLTFDAKGRVTSASTGSSIDVFALPEAGPGQQGFVTVGNNITISAGVISIPNATTVSRGVMRVGAGLVVTDGLVSVNTAIHPALATGGTFTGSISTTPSVSSVSGSTTLTYTASNVFDLTLTGNITLNVPAGVVAGGTMFIVLRQDGVGGRTCTFNSAYKFESGASTTLTTAANSVDLLRVVVVSPSLLVAKLYKNFV